MFQIPVPMNVDVIVADVAFAPSPPVKVIVVPVSPENACTSNVIFGNAAELPSR
jgi:hypothetical protein